MDGRASAHCTLLLVSWCRLSNWNSERNTYECNAQITFSGHIYCDSVCRICLLSKQPEEWNAKMPDEMVVAHTNLLTNHNHNPFSSSERVHKLKSGGDPATNALNIFGDIFVPQRLWLNLIPIFHIAHCVWFVCDPHLIGVQCALSIRQNATASAGSDLICLIFVNCIGHALAVSCAMCTLYLPIGLSGSS